MLSRARQQRRARRRIAQRALARRRVERVRPPAGERPRLVDRAARHPHPGTGTADPATADRAADMPARAVIGGADAPHDGVELGRRSRGAQVSVDREHLGRRDARPPGGSSARSRRGRRAADPATRASTPSAIVEVPAIALRPSAAAFSAVCPPLSIRCAVPAVATDELVLPLRRRTAAATARARPAVRDPSRRMTRCARPLRVAPNGRLALGLSLLCSPRGER